MKILSQEHYELMAMFEREFRGNRLDREDKQYWTRGAVYQDGRVNELFLAYRKGFAFARAAQSAETEQADG